MAISKAARQLYDKRKYEENVQVLRDLRESTPCMDCGHKFPYYVMQFDHSLGGATQYPTKMVRNIKAALAEAAKCEIVCANCHCIRTHERGQARGH